MDAQLPQYKNEEVELAMLWFLDQNVRAQLQHSSKVWMSKVLGITSNNPVLEEKLQKSVKEKCMLLFSGFLLIRTSPAASRSQHLSVDGSSPNRILLFREASKAICALIQLSPPAVVLLLVYIATCFLGHPAKEDKKTLRGRDISEDGQRSFHFMQQNPDILQQVMSVLMNTIIFGD